MSKVEVRRKDGGTIDEIVARDVNIHIERMDDHRWFINIWCDDEVSGLRDFRFWLGSQKRRHRVDVTYHESS